MAVKRARQAALLRLVAEHEVRSQQELVELLDQAGQPATQASVSRDLRELQLVKVDGRYVRATAAGEPGDAPDVLREFVRSVSPVGANLVVIRTATGSANAVAVELDRMHAADVAGTIAGDDTIFVAVGSRSAQGRLLAVLRSGMSGVDHGRGATAVMDGPAGREE